MGCTSLVRAKPIRTRRFWFGARVKPRPTVTGFRASTSPINGKPRRSIVTVPEGFEAVSNGKLVQRQDNPSDKTVTFDWKQEIPHPSYLVTLVVGEFDVVRHEWEGIPVLYYVPKGHRAEAEPTYGRTPEMLSYFSKLFGVRYPWAKYAQVTCFQFGGGMENTSATTMGDGILRDQRSLLDRNSESIVSHELAHQWWGDMVTCRDWSHTWLNEGFASYAEALWDEHARGRDEYAYNMDRKAVRAIRAGKERPVMDRRYTSPDAMFDDRSYPKGAWVVHMLRNRLGDDAFWKGIQRYAMDNQFHSVESYDLRRSLERATGRDLERFFYDWVERPGNPDVEVTTEYVPDSRQARLDHQANPGRRTVRVSAEDRPDVRGREGARRSGRDDDREGTSHPLALAGAAGADRCRSRSSHPDRSQGDEGPRPVAGAIARIAFGARTTACRSTLRPKQAHGRPRAFGPSLRPGAFLGSEDGIGDGARQGQGQGRQASASEWTESVRCPGSKSVCRSPGQVRPGLRDYDDAERHSG